MNTIWKVCIATSLRYNSLRSCNDNTLTLELANPAALSKGVTAIAKKAKKVKVPKQQLQNIRKNIQSIC